MTTTPARAAPPEESFCDARLNWRYQAYCHAHGRTSAEQLQHDDQRWPGGKMTGYVCWNSALWAEFQRQFHRGSFIDSRCDHVGYDRWLAAMIGGH